MQYPVNVFTGSVREYEGSRPSAIAKLQVDGELELTERGLVGVNRRKRKFTAAPIARCAIIRASITQTGCRSFPSRQNCSALQHLARTYRRLG